MGGELGMSIDKKRVLVPISFSFSIRYLYRTGMLKHMRQFCTPVIVLTWNEEELIKEMQADGFEVHLISESIKQYDYNNSRVKIDYWFNNFVQKSRSKKVQQKYLNQYVPLKRRLLKSAREHYNVSKFYIPAYKQKIFDLERRMLKEKTNYNDMVALVKSLNIDAVFTVTPFHTQEDMLLRACKDSGKQMITSILSFDNLTKRGWIPVEYDVYMVWNKYNKQEAINFYPNATNRNNVHIVGAAQFDFYFNDNYLLPKTEWQQLVGLNQTNKPVILYAGGPQRLFPNEPQYLKHILQAIDSGEISKDVVVLFRCHPVDKIERWKDWVGEHPNLIYDASWTGKDKLTSANITDTDIKKLCSTLAYTDVHVNLCSTMTVDGSVYKKPQIGPAYDDVNPAKASLLRGMYDQDHFKPIVNSKGLQLATSKQQMVNLLNAALTTPGLFTGYCEKVQEEIITYRDGRSTERVLAVLKEALQ